MFSGAWVVTTVEKIPLRSLPTYRVHLGLKYLNPVAYLFLKAIFFYNLHTESPKHIYVLQ